MKTLSRRDALRISAGVVPALLIGCAGARRELRPQNYINAINTNASLATLTPPAACDETHNQIEGPYYRQGAPERWDLVDPGMKGTIVELDGRVTGLACDAGQRDIELDVWQANDEGRYDNDGSFGMPPPRYMLRGRVRTDANGRYHVRTVLPGHYLNGSQYRPAHIHVKARGSGFHTLTTQLYFPGDPYNDIDPFLHRSLIMAVDGSAARLKAKFDFVLREV